MNVIPGFETRYSVSEYGDVINIKTGHKLVPYTDYEGYIRVGLYKDGVRRYYGVHQLVAMAYIPNPDNLPIVNHKDEDKSNNYVGNLEWCDYGYSTRYGTRNLRTGRANAKKVYQYLNDELVGVWLGTKTAGLFLGISPQKISDCARGQKKSAGGYTWSYVLEAIHSPSCVRARKLI